MFQTQIKTDVATELITLANAKYYLKQNYTTGSDATLVAEDAKITRLIKTVREQCENYCNASFAQKTLYCQFESDPGNNVYTLPFPPVNTVSAVSLIDLNGDATALVLNTSYWVRGLNKEQVIISSTGSIPVSIPVVVNSSFSVKVEYIAGYASADAVPEVVIEAMYKAILFNYRMIGDDPEGDKMIVGVLPHQAKAMLKPYRNLIL